MQSEITLKSYQERQSQDFFEPRSVWYFLLLLFRFVLLTVCVNAATPIPQCTFRGQRETFRSFPPSSMDRLTQAPLPTELSHCLRAVLVIALLQVNVYKQHTEVHTGSESRGDAQRSPLLANAVQEGGSGTMFSFLGLLCVRGISDALSA